MGNNFGCYRFKSDEFEDLFIEFYLVNDFVPVVTELSDYGLPTSTTIKRRFNLTYNEFLAKLGLPLNKRTSKPKTRSEMINDLQTLAEELGRVPTISDINGRNSVRGKGTYTEIFGSWSNALKEAGLDPVWCPVSDEELIEELQEFYRVNKRSPTTRDKLKYGFATFSNRFGTWNNALTKAGLPHNDSIFGKRTYGKDGVLYDSISESIVANWLYDHEIEYESHVPYFNKLIADFKVKDVYIEFFGLHHSEEYMKKVKLKRYLCKKNKVNLVELFEQDLTNLDRKLKFLIDDSRDGEASE